MKILLFLFLSMPCRASVSEVYLHIDPPAEGIEIRDVLDISQVVSIGYPQLPASGLILHTDEMAGTMEDLHSILHDFGPVRLKLDPQEPLFLVFPLNNSNILTIEPDKSARRYSKEDRFKLEDLARRSQHLGELIMLEWLRLLRK